MSEASEEALLMAGVRARDQIARAAVLMWQDGGFNGGSPDLVWNRASQEQRGKYLWRVRKMDARNPEGSPNAKADNAQPS